MPRLLVPGLDVDIGGVMVDDQSVIVLAIQFYNLYLDSLNSSIRELKKKLGYILTFIAVDILETILVGTANHFTNPAKPCSIKLVFNHRISIFI